MIPRMGDRPPIPIRDPVREAAAARPSEVKTYKLPPEEIERIFSGAKKPAFYEKPPMQLTTDWKHQPKEDDEMNMTKREYLAECLVGKTRTQICKERAKNAPSFYAQLAKWGIKDKADEDKALEELRAKQQPKSTEPKQEPPRLEQGGDVSKPEPAEEAKLTGATITGVSTYPHLELSRDALTLRIAPAIEWFTPAIVRTAEPTISISRHGFAIDSATSQRYGLSPGDRVKIGFAGRQLVVAADPTGLRLRRSGTAGCKLSSETLAKWSRWQRVVKRRYAARLQDGMIVADVEVTGE